VAPRAGDFCPGLLLVAVAGSQGAFLHPPVSGLGFGKWLPLVIPRRLAVLHRRPGRNARRTDLARPPGDGVASPIRRRRSRPTNATPRERAPCGRDNLLIFLILDPCQPLLSFRGAEGEPGIQATPEPQRWIPGQHRTASRCNAPGMTGGCHSGTERRSGIQASSVAWPWSRICGPSLRAAPRAG